MADRIPNFLDHDGRLTVWPAKAANKVAVLEYLGQSFGADRFYSESEINELLNRRHRFGDPALLRRELVSRGHLHRARDCSAYWGRQLPVIPAELTTDRLAIVPALEVPPDDIRQVLESTSYITAWTGYTVSNLDPVDEFLYHPELPPSGRSELNHTKALLLSPHRVTVGVLEYYHGHPEPTTFLVGLVAVLPEYQRQGLAREAVGEVLVAAARIGYRKASVVVSAKNWPAIRSAHQLGFQRIKKIVGDRVHSDESFMDLILEKDLS